MKKTIATHASIWLIFFLTRIMRDISSMTPLDWLEVISFAVPTISFFYVVAFIIAPLLPQKSFFRFSLFSIAAISTYAIFRYFTHIWLFGGKGMEGQKATFFITSNVWNGFIFTITACGYYLARKYYREEQNRQKLQRELLLTELAFLKSQTNPHFLHNSLNFLYSQAIGVSDNLAKSILLLSDIMRYALDNVDAQGKVPLSKEVQHLENYIEMHRLRYKNKLNVVFNKIIDPLSIEAQKSNNDRQILPFVLISFVENAFKHGLVTKSDKPMTLSLHLKKEGINFKVKNYIDRQAVKQPTSGVGLNNVKRMLALAYPNAHQLDIVEENDYFEVTLELLTN